MKQIQNYDTIIGFKSKIVINTINNKQIGDVTYHQIYYENRI
jgi:hypothetical protein